MSLRVYFMFASGLKKSITVPKGTLARFQEHVAEVELALKLQTEQYKNNPPHWTHESKRFAGIDDRTVCNAVEEHNNLVRNLYATLEIGSYRQSKERDEAMKANARYFDTECSHRGTEKITPRQAATFWHALELLDVPPERWTADYYRARMECLFAAMRGEESEGITYDAPALTVKQAGAVVQLFAGYLDRHDIRLDVPHGRDYLCDSAEYHWCDQKCFKAIHRDDLEYKEIEGEEGEEGEDIVICPVCGETID